MQRLKRYNTYIQAVRFLPLVTVISFSFALLVVVILGNISKQNAVLDTLHNDFIEQKKRHVNLVVEQISRQLEYEIGRSETKIKERIKKQVSEAFVIAQSIYQSNNHHPLKEVKELIKETLRPIRHNNNRGYFFIIDRKSGQIIMNGADPKLEGNGQEGYDMTRVWAICKRMIRLTNENKGGAYLTWSPQGWTVKELNKKVLPPSWSQDTKIGFVKAFEELDWIIGSGEILSDSTHDLQKNILLWIANTYTEGDGYIFIMDNQGRTLLYKNNNDLGANIIEKFHNDSPPSWESVLLMKQGRGFLNSSNLPSGKAKLQEEKNGKDSKLQNQPVGNRITYVRAIPDWKWIVGAGEYLSEIVPALERQKKILQKENRNEFYTVLTICALLVLLTTLIAHYISTHINQQFKDFLSSLEESDEKQRKTREELYRSEHLDFLTNLPNRILFLEHLKKSTQDARKENYMLAIVSIGLDNFSKINEHYSYAMGDKVLQSAARRFTNQLEPEDMVSHYSGDEFIFCFNVLYSREEAISRIENIRRQFQTPFIIEDETLKVSCTIGVTIYPDEGGTPAELISKSQTVLKRAKQHERGGMLFYDQGVKKQLDREIRIEHIIEDAIDQSEFSLVYQPQIHCGNEQLNSVEALCRWQSKGLGFISPLEFIPIAESSGVIFRLGEYIFEQACLDALKIPPQQGKQVGISINISPRQLLHPNFTQRIAAISERTNLDKSRITLEITENILIDDVNVVLPILTTLKEMGFDISLDDFGTGFSSLRYLNSLPISEIKIDKAFIDQLFTSKQSENLIRSIIAIGSSSNLTIVAEGVETKEQADWLKRHKCSLIQGYYYSRPLKIEELVKTYKEKRESI